MMCKWLSDEFSAVCMRTGCPYCATWCPVTDHPEICKYCEAEVYGRRLKDIVCR